MKISVNGAIVDEREAVISVYDHGFLYGMGLFETFRTYGGKPFLLREHLSRLADGCAELGFRYDPDETRTRTLIERLLQENGLSDAYIRFTVTGGTGPLGLPGDLYEEPVEIVYVKPLSPLMDSLYRKGKPLQLLSHARNTPEGAYRLKSLHYMNNILAKRELSGYPEAAAENAEGLLLTKDGYIAEGIVSNVFFVRAGVLHTPSLDTGILAGITRSMVLSLAARLGMRTEEGLYRWADLLEADEIFLTTSIQELVPVNALYATDGRRYQVGAGNNDDAYYGEWTGRLLASYRKTIEEMVGE